MWVGVQWHPRGERETRKRVKNKEKKEKKEKKDREEEEELILETRSNQSLMSLSIIK